MPEAYNHPRCTGETMSALVEREMAKRNDVSVKMDAKVVEDCRIAAAFRGVSLAEYLSDAMKAVAKRDIDEGYARRAQGGQLPKGRGAK
jgi:hypothetical protein